MTESPERSDSVHGSDDDSAHENENGNEEENGTNSGTRDAAGKAPTTKDKECQYCHQKFTSSSLGRHLDQFIYKKKPDGVHDVDEIRRLRGGITRRTARSASKKDPEDGPPKPYSPSLHYSLPSYSELLNKTASDMRLNRVHWQATGTGTDPPPLNANAAPTSAPSPPIPSPSNPSVAGQKRTYSMFAADLPAQTTTSASSETLRALELSLREVLDAVRTATSLKAPESKPFDFHFESQTFAFLCLALLPVPPTLLKPAPFATPTTIPLGPPGPDQYGTLQKWVVHKIDAWKWATLTAVQRASAPGTNLSEEVDEIATSAKSMQEAYMTHLDSAYQSFMSYSPESRLNLWTIEVLRAFKVEQDKVTESKNQIELLETQVKHLQQQLDHLSRCQWPREMALWPPEKPSFGIAGAEELRRVNLLKSTQSPGVPYSGSDAEFEGEHRAAAAADRWDYDNIVAKWRRHVRNDRARRTGVQPSGVLMDLRAVGEPAPSAPAPSASGTVNGPDITRSPNAHMDAGSYSTPLAPGAHLPDLGHQARSLDTSPSLNGINTLPRPVSRAVGPDGKKRSIIVSDVEEHYGPRYAGLRR